MPPECRRYLLFIIMEKIRKPELIAQRLTDREIPERRRDACSITWCKAERCAGACPMNGDIE
jgi:hypothetical protein